MSMSRSRSPRREVVLPSVPPKARPSRRPSAANAEAALVQETGSPSVPPKARPSCRPSAANAEAALVQPAALASSVDLEVRPARWERGGRRNRSTRGVRDALYFLFEGLRRTRDLNMPFGVFRNTIQSWLAALNQRAVADVDEDVAARTPLHEEEAGVVASRELERINDETGFDVDSVDSLNEMVRVPAGAIVRQPALSNAELRATYGIGHALLLGSLDPSGSIPLNLTPLVNVGGQGWNRGLGRRSVTVLASSGTNSQSSRSRSSQVAPSASSSANSVVDPQVAPSASSGLEDLVAAALDTPADVTCIICQGTHGDDNEQLVRLVCGHEFHELCIVQWEETRRNPVCPVCRRGVYRVPVGPLPSQAAIVEVPLEMSRLYRTRDFHDYAELIAGLEWTDRLDPSSVLGGFPEMTSDDAFNFVEQWLGNRTVLDGGRTSTLLQLFSPLRVHTATAGDVGVIGGVGNPHDFWVVADWHKASSSSISDRISTWDVAYHASHMGCFYAITVNGRLEAGYRSKRARNGEQAFGVFCHKHGTRRKCQSYLGHFQFHGFVAAPLFELRVDPSRRRTCGDQWCCPPDAVQIKRVWFHIVPNTSVGMNKFWLIKHWRPEYELYPSF